MYRAALTALLRGTGIVLLQVQFAICYLLFAIIIFLQSLRSLQSLQSSFFITSTLQGADNSFRLSTIPELISYANLLDRMQNYEESIHDGECRVSRMLQE